jgi:anhydro-N-acetylmuramic acid kinase
MKKSSLIVAGVMSGTSADGIDVALVRLPEPRPPAHTATQPSTLRGRAGRVISKPDYPRFELLGHKEYAYPKKVRAAVLAAMNAAQARVADLARLNFILGELYADAVLATENKFRVKAQLVGCHGQTLYHQGESRAFLGRKVAATWQTGEAAIVAAHVGAPVVSDFRPADMAAGGKGAPLVPFLDYLLFRDAQIGRIVQNIGGIANFTAIPAGTPASEVIACDTGPGNMVIDAVTEQLFARPFDRGGKIAASGKVLDTVINDILSHEFFRKPSPKTAGREEFGREFVLEFLRRCGSCRKQDAIATATALTARSIADAVRKHAGKKSGSRDHLFQEMILSGGGSNNSTLVSMLGNELRSLGVRLRFTDEFGIPSAAKEATAFAIMAHETWYGRPSNVPSATGAKRAAVLGKISFP